MEDPAPPPRFGHALLAARLLRGFSRAYVAERSRIHPGRLKYLEEGRDEPDYHEWRQIWAVMSTEEAHEAARAAKEMAR